MSQKVLGGVLGLVGATATFGGIALLALGHKGIGAAFVVGSMVSMGVAVLWGVRADREAGHQALEPLGSARRRAGAGAGLVAAAMVIGFAYAWFFR